MLMTAFLPAALPPAAPWCAAAIAAEAAAADGDAAPPPAPPAAPAPSAPGMPVETIEVRGEREGPTALDPTAFATVIRAEEFAHRIVTLSELMRETVGVQVKSLGGEYATLSIRGSSAEQVIVYLDGVPLNRALGGGVNLADLPLAQVESIAVYRGFTPAGLPAASIGGAVMITTRRGDGAPRASARLQGGSFGGAEAGVSFAAARGAADVTLALEAARGDGDFEHWTTNGTPHDATDDGLRPRVNNDFARRRLAGTAAFRLGDRTRLNLSTDLLRRDQGVPGKEPVTRSRGRYDVTRGLLRADLEAAGLAGGRLLVRGAADLTRHAEAFADPGLDESTENRIGSFGQEAGLTFIASRRHALSLFLGHRSESADLLNHAALDPDLGTARRRDLVATIEDQIALASDRFVINPSLRHERYDSDFDPGPGATLIPETLRRHEGRTTGKIGFRARLGERLTIRGNAGRFFRIPDFIELYGYTGSVRGNGDLRPEHGRSFDLGVQVDVARAAGRLRRARFETTLFETLADDLILFTGRAQLSVVAHNFGRARIRGVETTVSLGFGPRLSGSLNATFQRAVNESGDPTTGRLLPTRPSREAGAGLDLRLGPGRLFYAFTYVGRNYLDAQNTDAAAVPARYLHDLGYRIDLHRGWEATFEVKNIGDHLTYDVAGFPLPGRNFAARLAWRR
jgi:iron complex outermembrane receptor protein